MDESALKAVMDLRKYLFTATVAQTPNFGGHHGVNGYKVEVGAQIMRAIDSFIGELRSGKYSRASFEQVMAQCNLARTTDILSDSDMIKVDKYLDSIEENIQWH